MGEGSKVREVDVKLKEVVKWYNIWVNGSRVDIRGSNKEVWGRVRGSVYEEDKESGVNIELVGESEVKGCGWSYKFKEGGSYELEIVE